MAIVNRILVMSDLQWTTRYSTSLQHLINLTVEIDPTIVLLAGDLVDDVHHKVDDHQFGALYWKQLHKYLRWLDSRNIHCLIVRGNWDTSLFYKQIFQLDLPYIQDVSEGHVEANGLQIAGISYDFAHHLRSLRKFHEKQMRPVDILLTHAELKRRIWLFDLPANLIITGHFASLITPVRDQVFMALNLFPKVYSVIEYREQSIDITLHRGNISDEIRVIDRVAYWQTEEPKQSREYRKQMERVLSVKNEFAMMSDHERAEMLKALAEDGISRPLLQEFLR